MADWTFIEWGTLLALAAGVWGFFKLLRPYSTTVGPIEVKTDIPTWRIVAVRLQKNTPMCFLTEDAMFIRDAAYVHFMTSDGTESKMPISKWAYDALKGYMEQGDWAVARAHAVVSVQWDLSFKATKGDLIHPLKLSYKEGSS